MKGMRATALYISRNLLIPPCVVPAIQPSGGRFLTSLSIPLLRPTRSLSTVRARVLTRLPFRRQASSETGSGKDEDHQSLVERLGEMPTLLLKAHGRYYKVKRLPKDSDESHALRIAQAILQENPSTDEKVAIPIPPLHTMLALKPSKLNDISAFLRLPSSEGESKMTTALRIHRFVCEAQGPAGVTQTRLLRLHKDEVQEMATLYNLATAKKTDIVRELMQSISASDVDRLIVLCEKLARYPIKASEPRLPETHPKASPPSSLHIPWEANPTDGPTMELTSLTVPELCAKARHLGISAVGLRQTVLHGIQSHIRSFTSRPLSIVAIDAGVTNIGYVHLLLPEATSPDPRPVIKDWGVQGLDVKFADLPGMAKECKRVLDVHLALEGADAYIVERQSWRTVMGRLTVPMGILSSRTVEAMLLAMVHDRGGGGIVTMGPGVVSTLWDLQGIKGRKRKKSEKVVPRNKKRTAVTVVRELVGTGKVVCPERLVRMFETTQKRDDLSDALLIGLTWFAHHAATGRELADAVGRNAAWLNDTD